MFIAIFKSDTDSATVLDDNLIHTGAGDGGAAMVYETIMHSVRYGAHTPARESPGAHASVHVTHRVMQQDVSGTGRHHAESRPDDAAAGMRSFD